MLNADRLSLIHQWTSHGQAAAIENVGVDHGGFDVFVAEQLLHGMESGCCPAIAGQWKT